VQRIEVACELVRRVFLRRGTAELHDHAVGSLMPKLPFAALLATSDNVPGIFPPAVGSPNCPFALHINSGGELPGACYSILNCICYPMLSKRIENLAVKCAGFAAENASTFCPTPEGVA
jgi:hypothetical protein